MVLSFLLSFWGSGFLGLGEVEGTEGREGGWLVMVFGKGQRYAPGECADGNEASLRFYGHTLYAPWNPSELPPHPVNVQPLLGQVLEGIRNSCLAGWGGGLVPL